MATASNPSTPDFEGKKAVVFVYDGFARESRKASKEDKAKIEATLKRYCEKGEVRNGQRWNVQEGRHHAGGQLGKMLRVQAVKGDQLRCYGVEGRYKSKKAFFITAADVKKRNKAYQSLLVMAADRAWEMVKGINGAEV